MHKGWLRRSVAPVSLGAVMVVAAASLAYAANGPYAFQFTIPGGGGTACTTQTRIASNFAPDIAVNLTAIGNNSGSNAANFTAANANCSVLRYAHTLTITAGSGYHNITVNDTPGETIKLMGGTALFQGSPQVFGDWKT